MNKEVTGTEDMELGGFLIKSSTDAAQAISNLPPESVISYFEELRPQNALETMLIGQMASAHAHCIEMFKQASQDSYYEAQLERLKMAQRLMKTFASCLETLEKTRRKGSQNVKVEHVHVNSGGQAIVGNVDRGG